MHANIQQSFKYINGSSSLLEEWARYPAWWLVRLFLRVPGMHPHMLVLLGFVIRVCGIYALSQGAVLLAAALIFLGMLMDAADGQFARFTGITSSLGALYDLASDFCFWVMLFVSFVAISNGSALWLAVLGVVGFVCFMLNTEIWSFVVWRQSNAPAAQSAKQAFYRSPAIDDKPWPLYAMKVRAMRRFFECSWGVFLRLALRHQGWGPGLKHPRLIHAYALAGGTTQTTIAVLLIGFAQPLYYFFVYQLVLTVLLLLLVRYNERTAS